MIAELYRTVHATTTELVSAPSVDPETPVAACPGWTVADVVRHLVGLCDNWLTGDLEVYASAPWTDAQVAAFAGMDLPVVVSAWQDRLGPFTAILDDPGGADHLTDKITTVIGRFSTAGFPAGILVDASQHCADISFALGVPCPLPDDVVAFATKAMMGSLRGAWKHMELPSVAIATTDTGASYQLGDPGEAAVSLAVGSRDLFRVCGGRRSLSQIQGLNFDGPADAIDIVRRHMVVPFFAAPSMPVEAGP